MKELDQTLNFGAVPKFWQPFILIHVYYQE